MMSHQNGTPFVSYPFNVSMPNQLSSTVQPSQLSSTGTVQPSQLYGFSGRAPTRWQSNQTERQTYETMIQQMYPRPQMYQQMPTPQADQSFQTRPEFPFTNNFESSNFLISQLPGQQSGQLSGQQSGQQSGQLSGQPSGQLSGQPSGQLSGRPSGQLSGRPSTQLSGRPFGQLSGQPFGQLSGQQFGQHSGQPCGQQSSLNRLQQMQVHPYNKVPTRGHRDLPKEKAATSTKRRGRPPKTMASKENHAHAHLWNGGADDLQQRNRGVDVVGRQTVLNIPQIQQRNLMAHHSDISFIAPAPVMMQDIQLPNLTAVRPAATISTAPLPTNNVVNPDEDDDDVILTSWTNPKRTSDCIQFKKEKLDEPLAFSTPTRPSSTSSINQFMADLDDVTPLIICEDTDTNQPDDVNIVCSVGEDVAHVASGACTQGPCEDDGRNILKIRRELLSKIQDECKQKNAAIDEDETLSYSDRDSFEDIDSMGLSPVNITDVEQEISVDINVSQHSDNRAEPLDLCVSQHEMKLEDKCNQMYPLDLRTGTYDGEVISLLDDDDDQRSYSPITPPPSPGEPNLLLNDQARNHVKSLLYSVETSWRKRLSTESSKSEDHDSGRESVTPGTERSLFSPLPASTVEPAHEPEQEPEDVSQMLALEWLSKNVTGIT